MDKHNDFRLPAEWEAQSGIMLTWPHKGTDWAPMLEEITTTYRQIAREICRREGLLIVAPDSVQSSQFFDGQRDEDKSLKKLCTVNTNDTWARDHGFITLVRTEGTTTNSKLLDFKFNGWGEKFPSELDNAINRQLYDRGVLKGEYADHLDFVLEGGSIESDGHGTIFTTSQCLLAPHRNQPLSRDEIEERLKEWLCADRVLWIDHGQLTGDDTDGHIDTLVRIAPDDTLLYVGCDNPDDEDYEEMQLMEEQLHTFRTIDNRPYRLLRLPMPRPVYEPSLTDAEQCTVNSEPCTVNPEQKDRLPATYANFLIINGAVLVPTYDQPDLDREAMRIIGQAFPDRDIVPIDCRSIIRQHGSLHCCTMQFPKGVFTD